MKKYFVLIDGEKKFVANKSEADALLIDAMLSGVQGIDWTIYESDEPQEKPKAGDWFIVCEKRVKKYITGLNIQWAHKNIITLLRAYAKIMDQTEYDLILVGRKLAAVEEMQKVIAENHMEDRVHFTGYVSQEELDRITAETRIYVNPSFFEGFGMTAVEMMGGCVPTIVADTTAMPETTLGLCRYYGPADDADALARVLLEELENRKVKSENRFQNYHPFKCFYLLSLEFGKKASVF